MAGRSFSVIVAPSGDGGYTVLVPAFPEIVAEGRTEALALENARTAIRTVLDYRQGRGMSIPEDIVPVGRSVLLN